MSYNPDSEQPDYEEGEEQHHTNNYDNQQSSQSQQHNDYSQHQQHDNSAANQQQQQRNQSQQRQSDIPDVVRLYLGNLSLDVKQSDVENLLQPYGITVTKCDFKTAHNRNDQQYCFVTGSDTSDNHSNTDEAVKNIHNNIIPNLGQYKLRLEKTKPVVTCNICGKYGHKAWECRTQQGYNYNMRGGYQHRGGHGYGGGYNMRGGYHEQPYHIAPYDRHHPYASNAPRGRGRGGGGYRGGYNPHYTNQYAGAPREPYYNDYNTMPYDPTQPAAAEDPHYYDPSQSYYQQPQPPVHTHRGGFRGRGRGGYNAQPAYVAPLPAQSYTNPQYSNTTQTNDDNATSSTNAAGQPTYRNNY